MSAIARQNRIEISGSSDQTIQLGQDLASSLRNRDVLVLTGPLGAGKTCLIRGIAIGLGVNDDDIKSPSFTLVNEYAGSHLPFFHIDLYRMKDTSELYNIGWDDYLMRDGIVAVEWGEKAADFLPKKRIEISIVILSDNERRISIDFINS